MEKTDPPPRKDEDIYINDRYKIIHENDDFLVVDKPAPCPIHAVSRFGERNLQYFLERDLGVKLHLVHRLDSETSGVVVIAKHAESATLFGKLFERRQMEKEYQAVVFGVPSEKSGVIQAPMKSVKERFCYRYEVNPEGKPAETYYEVLAEHGGCALLKLKPITGRTHQLRVHLAHIGHPIVGDKVYKDLSIYETYVHHGWLPEMAETVGLSRLALHASKIRFTNPQTQTSFEFESDIPVLFEQFLNSKH